MTTQNMTTQVNDTLTTVLIRGASQVLRASQSTDQDSQSHNPSITILLGGIAGAMALMFICICKCPPHEEVGKCFGNMWKRNKCCPSAQDKTPLLAETAGPE